MHNERLFKRTVKQTHNLWQIYGRNAQDNVPLQQNTDYIYPTCNGALFLTEDWTDLAILNGQMYIHKYCSKHLGILVRAGFTVSVCVWYLSQYLCKFLMRNLFLRRKWPSRGNPRHTARRLSTSVSVLDRGLNDVLFFCVVSCISSGLYWFRRKQLMKDVLIGEVRDRNYCRSDSFPALMFPRPITRGWCNISSSC